MLQKSVRHPEIPLMLQDTNPPGQLVGFLLLCLAAAWVFAGLPVPRGVREMFGAGDGDKEEM